MICTGNTGHVEAIEIMYDPKKISYLNLLEVFFDTHDPTQVDGQGNDIGSQYRSAIFYTDKTQKENAKTYKEKLSKSNIYQNPIVTKIEPLDTFYKAEEYHQKYIQKNSL